MLQQNLGAFIKQRKVTISVVNSLLPSARPSVRMEQLGSHWTDLYEIRYLRILLKSVEETIVSLKCDKNKGYFTQSTMYIYDNISLNSS